MLYFQAESPKNKEAVIYSILIIEDNRSYCNVMKTILQMEGFDVRIAYNGHSGLCKLRDKRPDLILCDVMMPIMDGHSLLEALKDDKALGDIPFIFVTAMDERADIRRGMSAGADDYLPKPFSADELLAAVNGRLSRHERIHKYFRTSGSQKEYTALCEKITKREREVLRMVGHGHTSRDIAEQLGVCIKTVEVHRANLMNKLDAGNAAALARWALIAEQAESESG